MNNINFSVHDSVNVTYDNLREILSIDENKYATIGNYRDKIGQLSRELVDDINDSFSQKFYEATGKEIQTNIYLDIIGNSLIPTIDKLTVTGIRKEKEFLEMGVAIGTNGKNITIVTYHNGLLFDDADSRVSNYDGWTENQINRSEAKKLLDPKGEYIRETIKKVDELGGKSSVGKYDGKTVFWADIPIEWFL